MDISVLNSISGTQGITGTNAANSISSLLSSSSTSNDTTNAFDMLLESAKSLIEETNDYSNAAEEAELQYAMGELTSTHELQVIQQKANISLQYTIAVRNAVMDAYDEIMQLQF